MTRSTCTECLNDRTARAIVRCEKVHNAATASAMPYDPLNTCIHRETGICERCAAERDADPQSWIEFGRHPEGVRNWNALNDEMKADRCRPRTISADDDIPF
jgi:hypothetical protein